MSELILRQAIPTDAPALAVLAASFAEANPSPSPSAVKDLARVADSVDALLNAPNCQIVVGELLSRVVAAMVLCRIPSLTHAGRTTLFIDLLVVEEACRRRGIGTALVKYAIERARNNDVYKILLVTRGDNMPARKLYARCLFDTNGTGLAFYLTSNLSNVGP